MKAQILFLFSIYYFLIGSTPVMKAQTGKFYSTDKELSNSLINAVYQDRKGFIWIATENGLNKFDGTRFMTYYKNDLSQSSQGITGNELNRVYADNKRPIIWIATQRDGLNAYNYNKQVFTAYSHNPDDPHSQ